MKSMGIFIYSEYVLFVFPVRVDFKEIGVFVNGFGYDITVVTDIAFHVGLVFFRITVHTVGKLAVLYRADLYPSESGTDKGVICYNVVVKLLCLPPSREARDIEPSKR